LSSGILLGAVLLISNLIKYSRRKRRKWNSFLFSRRR
jgi:hypothetical protein